MAECELTSKTYEEIRVVPGGTKVMGDIELFGSTYGFFLDTFNAAEYAAGESATLIRKAENVKVTKIAGVVWVAGDPIFWLSASENFTNVDNGSGVKVGVAYQAAENADIVGYINFSDHFDLSRGLHIGTNAVPYIMAASDPIFELYTTSPVESGTIRSAIINLVPTGVAGAMILEALYVNITSGVRTGSWANAIVGRIDFGALGDAAGGMAASIVGEMNLPGKTTPGGALYCFDAEMNARVSATVAPGHTVAFMKMGLWGDSTAKTSFITNGYFMDIQGVTSVTDGFFEEISVTAAQVFDACLRIKVGSANYFIGLSDDKSFA